MNMRQKQLFLRIQDKKDKIAKIEKELDVLQKEYNEIEYSAIIQGIKDGKTIQVNCGFVTSPIWKDWDEMKMGTLEERIFEYEVRSLKVKD